MSAYYNPRTRQIVGCKRGTLTWYHEWRHRLQDLGGWVDTCNYVRLAFLIASIIVASVGVLLPSFFMSVMILVMVIGILLLELLLELDAWVYAVMRKCF